MMSEQPEDQASDGTRIGNTATGNASVEAQIGVVEGDAVFHKHETIYQVTSDDSAEHKYKIALNNLEGGIPRVAEDLIGQVLNAGLGTKTSEVAYYYAISVLSGRSLNQLESEQYDKLDHAFNIAKQSAHGEWWDAIRVMYELVWCAANTDPRDTTPLQVVPDSFHQLPSQRRAEITRHLDMILGGNMQEQLHLQAAEDAGVKRKSDDRINRAWKYFHSDPTEPRRAFPIQLRQGRPQSNSVTVSVLGLAAFGLLLTTSGNNTGDIKPLLGPLSVVLAGFLTVILYGSQIQALQIRRQLKAQDRARFPNSTDDEDYSYLGRETGKFAAFMRRRINYYFFIYGPRKRTETWKAKTKTIKVALHDRIVRLYGTRRVPSTTLYWLIRWHAKQAKRQWDDGTLTEPHTKLQPAMSTVLLVWCGIAIAATGSLWLINVSRQFGAATVAISLAEIGVSCIAVFNLAYFVGYRRAMAQERAELNEIFQSEKDEFKRWNERLSDRPTDAEMASWLEHDKVYLKAAAMRRCNLRNREIISHVVLTAAKFGAKRARVLNGPPRYSDYNVLVFLLTENGVRVVEVDLEFDSAVIYNERRTAFSYGGLASAQVLEEGFRSAEGHRHTFYLAQETHVTDKDSLVLRRRFKLALVNDQKIEVVVVNYDGLIEENTGEDNAKLDKVALETSGAAGALQILESVAAEGREWLARERDRRDRNWQEWKQHRVSRIAITERPRIIGIESSTITEEPSVNRTAEWNRGDDHA